MDITTSSKQELIDRIMSILVSPTIKSTIHSSDADDLLYKTFVSSVKKGSDATAELPLDYILKQELFDLITCGTVFVESSVRFRVLVTTKRPIHVDNNEFIATYKGNEFNYVFLDNHPGIININRLKDIPVDYEGLMAVPATILEYKNITKFNIHKVLYTPKFNGKLLYARVVISNKHSV